MNISSFQKQYVIKAYGQRLGKRNLAKLRFSGKESVSPDTINISPEAKRKQLLHQMANNLAKVEKNGNLVSGEIIEKIEAKLGENVDIIPQKNKQGGFKFKVISKNNEETIKELSFEDLRKIVENIYKDNGESK